MITRLIRVPYQSISTFGISSDTITHCLCAYKLPQALLGNHVEVHDFWRGISDLEHR